jgi:hypothetical protein
MNKINIHFLAMSFCVTNMLIGSESGWLNKVHLINPEARKDYEITVKYHPKESSHSEENSHSEKRFQTIWTRNKKTSRITGIRIDEQSAQILKWGKMKRIS